MDCLPAARHLTTIASLDKRTHGFPGSRVYLKTPNAPGQRAFSRRAASFFLEIRQYSCEKMSCAVRKFLAAGHIESFQIHPKRPLVSCSSPVGASPSASPASSDAGYFPGKLEDLPGAPARFSQGRGRRQAGLTSYCQVCRGPFLLAEADACRGR